MASSSSPRYPECKICSYKQTRDRTPVPIYHHHWSTRQVRVLQGVEYSSRNRKYLCPSCVETHLVAMPYGLDICLSDSTLHNFHQPRDPGVICPPDSSHVDWVTIPGAKVEDLLVAWRAEYSRVSRPMRVLLVAGLNDLIKGGDFESLTRDIKRFQDNVSHQNNFHPGKSNSFAVAPLLPAPKLVWYTDNGPTSSTYVNRIEEMTRINEWIQTFNMKNGIHQVPRFHTMGIRTSKRKVEGKMVTFKTHRWNEWRASEQVEDKLHVVDKVRVKMGKYVLKYFQAEREMKGPLV